MNRQSVRLVVATALFAGSALALATPTQATEPLRTDHADWCRTYERQLLAVVNAISESVVLNLRLALIEIGQSEAQVNQVISVSKHPKIAAYVEQKHGRLVLGTYEALLDLVDCLKPSR